VIDAKQALDVGDEMLGEGDIHIVDSDTMRGAQQCPAFQVRR
jgi:hypothetical protein